jgi:dihydrofolate synthase/folylpolyglutamate synthase
MNLVQPILDRLIGLHPKAIDLSLGRIERLLAALGHPERRLPPVIHVAGTNGKGSTVAFMRAMLEAAGRGVHVYTSPHLVRFNERIRLAGPGGGRLVSDEELAVTLSEIEGINGDAPITFFEITTAAAFRLFAEHPADFLLLETGLGGRLDATNVVERPHVTVITPVSLDHARFLGDTVRQIAAEKAGIIKRGVPVVVARQSAEALDAIERQAARRAAPLHVSGQDWIAQEERGRLVFQDERGLLDLPLPRLLGRHQHENAGAAIAALRALGPEAAPERAVERGLLTVDWPARLQRLGAGRLVTLVPGSELWLDGGHNPDGARAVAAAVAEIEERAPRPLVLVLGMLSSKDAPGFLEHFAGLARMVLTVPIEGSEAHSARDLARIARGAGMRADVSDGVAAALAAVRDTAFEAPPRILVCGSLHLAGQVLAENGTLPS